MFPELISSTPTGSFVFRWPDSEEMFYDGWDTVVEFEGRRYELRHGVGRRLCFGRDRVHTVTWLQGAPTVEGAEAEDYTASRGIVSIIKAQGRDVVSHGDIPSGYEMFRIVRHRDEVDGPFARRGLAVKIREDDLASWALHAILRLRSKRR